MQTKSFLLFAAAPLVQWSAFVDSYYAWDFNSPASRERAYTTQEPKHNSLGLNLAMVSAKLETDQRRGAIVLQHGDSVDVNYSGEPNAGEGIKHVQEAYAGIKLGAVWVDAGIYLGHIGNESWISKDNWTYSRSMQLDYVPYYATGVRIVGERWQLHFMNGWQNIRENNSGKALGTQYVWKFGPRTLTYNTQVGDEVMVGRNTSGLRTYQNLHFDLPGVKVSWRGALDIGTQQVPGEEKANVWGATSSQWRWRVSEFFWQALRVEYFHDHKGVITGARNSGGFRVMGVSTNLDYGSQDGVLIRTEMKQLLATDPIYPGRRSGRSSSTVLASSLSVGF